MKAIEIIVPGQPIQQGSMQAFTDRAGHARMRHAKGDKLIAYRNLIRAYANEKTNTISEGVVCLAITFCFQRPKNHFTAKGAKSKHWTLAKTTAPDLDKLIRAVGDALTGIVYRDDSQIVEIQAKKMYSEKPETRITILKGDD